MLDTTKLSTRKKAVPTTPAPLKTVTASKAPAEKNIDDGSDIELEIAKHHAEVKKRQFYLLLGYL